MSTSHADGTSTTLPAPAASRGQKRSLRPGKAPHSPGAIIASVIIFIFLLIGVAPIISIILGSLKTTTQIVAEPLSLPNPIQFGNYARGWAGVAVGESMSTYFINTVAFSLVSVAVSTVVGTMAAYAIARSTSRMSTVFERSFNLLYALPYLAVIIPLFSITGTLGLRSNPLGIGLVFGAGWLFLTVVLMYGFFASFPLDVIEAAKTDGAGEIRIFWSQVIPMSAMTFLAEKPGGMLRVPGSVGMRRIRQPSMPGSSPSGKVMASHLCPCEVRTCSSARTAIGVPRGTKKRPTDLLGLWARKNA